MNSDAIVRVCCASCHGIMPRITVLITHVEHDDDDDRQDDRPRQRPLRRSRISSPMLQTLL